MWHFLFWWGVLLHASDIDEMPIILEMSFSLFVYDYSDMVGTFFFGEGVPACF